MKRIYTLILLLAAVVNLSAQSAGNLTATSAPLTISKTSTVYVLS